MRAIEFLTEYRNRMYQYIKSIVPTWPEYIVKDWLYSNFARGEIEGPNWSFRNVGEDIPKVIEGQKLSVDTKWQLVPNMKFTMDMWIPEIVTKLTARAGGKANPDQVPRDAERHATQSQLAQQQGGVRKEPVILVKRHDGYDLLEGWHRTIQHFHKFPDGYTGPAYVAVEQGQQGVAEGSLNEFAPVGGDDRESDEEELLRQLASMWWLGTEQQMIKAQKTLAAMGWEIGQDESGDDDAGVFVIRVGDVNGDSYMAFPHSELNLNEGLSKGT